MIAIRTGSTSVPWLVVARSTNDAMKMNTHGDFPTESRPALAVFVGVEVRRGLQFELKVQRTRPICSLPEGLAGVQAGSRVRPSVRYCEGTGRVERLHCKDRVRVYCD